MYNTFECHFKPNKKKQRELGDPVKPPKKTFINKKPKVKEAFRKKIFPADFYFP